VTRGSRALPGGGNVEHFSEAQWADFARDLVAPTMRATMQQHLDSGCKDCGMILSSLQHVYDFAKQEPGSTPPLDTVRIVKSQFVAASGLVSGRVRLLFDSLLQPAMAGVRGSISARQFLFETDELYIDLRLAPQAERLSLVGQIMDRAQSKQAVEGLTVQVHKGDAQLIGTSTNQFGEFQLEFDAAGDLYISIGQIEKQPIVLPLYGSVESR
jgi:hypothetical protein